MKYLAQYEKWLNSEYIDEETRTELLQIKDNEEEIKERFYCDLEFGTGGLRGVIGAGTNRMNIYTVRKASQGIANYICKLGKEAIERGVAIGFDSRHFSQRFAEETALVFNANGIRTYLFEKLSPTPMLSFAVRDLKAIAGVMITASHNPPEYNGYKVYWADGGQIVPELAAKLIEEVNKISDFSQIKVIGKEDAIKQGLFNIIEEVVIDRYINSVKEMSLIDDSMRNYVSQLKIIYTPLHGTGNLPVRRVLKELGFESVKVVKDQELPDPNFSTVKYPNPEDKEAFNLALEMANKETPDIILGTDPDCDRIGVVEKMREGEYVFLTGNQVGVLLADYILSRLYQMKKLPSDGVIIKTIVTTDMVKEIAADYGIKVLDTLTGFKFIGEKIKEFEETGKYQFILGFEESYGYLAGTYARDKDAVVAAALICEMAAYYKSRGISLAERLNSLMAKYGYYLEDLKSITLSGIEGQEKIKKIMDILRNTKPSTVGTREVIVLEDYLNQKRYNFTTSEEESIDLPQSNVLKFYLADKCCFTVRPSGTEPKLKIYFFVAGKSMDQSRELLETLKRDVMDLIDL